MERMTDPHSAPLSPPATPTPEQQSPEHQNSALAVLRAIDNRAEPDLKRAIPAVLITLVAFIVGERLGGIGRTSPGKFNLFGRDVVVQPGYLTIIVVVIALVFVLAGVIATRAVANELARVSNRKAGASAASAIRLICVIVGYLSVGLGLLGLLRVDLGNLLVGGAVTGVVIGIAAQQTLGNFFAGLVLLFARPYTPGERVKVRTGALGGPFEGVIVSAGLMYTTIETKEGPVRMPNAGLLGAAIGPAPEPVEKSSDDLADEPFHGSEEVPDVMPAEAPKAAGQGPDGRGPRSAADGTQQR